MREAREGRARHRAPRAGALLAWTLLVAPSACTPDAEGARASAPSGAPRLVSLVPAATRTLAVLDAGAAVVGRGTDDRTPGFEGVTDVGRVLEPRREALLALRPTAVLVWLGAASRLGDLERRGVHVVPVRAERLGDAPALARALGVLVGREAAAEALAAGLECALRGVERRTLGTTRPSVLWVVSSDPLVVAGPGTLPDDLLAVAGGRNVFADADASWPRPSPEAVYARMPDVVVWPAGPGVAPFATKRASAPWSRLPAVRRGAVHTVDPELFHEAGPRVALAAERLALLLHPASEAGRPVPNPVCHLPERNAP